MKDLYKRLGVDSGTDDLALRESIGALPYGEMATRRAAEYVLLEPGRRAVYDRNRRVLVTIGELRARLALNSRPFWRRGDFRDFSYPFGPAPRRSGFGRVPGLSRLRGRAGAAIDPVAAAIVSGPDPSPRSPDDRLLWLAAGAAVAFLILLAVVIANYVW